MNVTFFSNLIFATFTDFYQTVHLAVQLRCGILWDVWKAMGDRTAEWTFIMSLFLSRQECWAWSRIIQLVLFHLLALIFFPDGLLRIKYGEKDNCADGLNICLSSHHKHNHYTIKSQFAQLELSKSFPVALVRDKTMFRV